MDFINERFQGFRSLIGDDAFHHVRSAHVCIVGLGGVGSWVVEALARCGVGAITLVDLDEVCITNVNRQLHALTSTVGSQKTEVLANRITEINPTCSTTMIPKFFSEKTAQEVLATPFDLVVDTIDSVENKTELIAECVRRSIPLMVVGSGGDRLNPLGVEVVDLASTIHDPLLQIIRKRLRQLHGFPRGERARFGVPCIYAPLQRGPRDTSETATTCSPEKKTRKSCNDGLGSAVFLTGTLGFTAAAEAIKFLSLPKTERAEAYPWKKKREATMAEDEVV